ncbi:hypothetical protein [Limimaricola cinnabarinus]|uniref:Uncharacterized protein n=1 Tax=Limimaricola cinnabarinus LL-001 TaxID=1337093 RepID=U2Z333_9RHOB|nr:hypothetical protein [Limimaricola cinnabarinus]GAD55472.1 hypothetical protein MBELCI_1524 [Limimaricola cinnabarinus LL-001]
MKASTAPRARFPLAHLAVEVVYEQGNTPFFALVACEAIRPADRKPIFSGPVPSDMPAQLRALADHLEGVGA